MFPERKASLTLRIRRYWEKCGKTKSTKRLKLRRQEAHRHMCKATGYLSGSTRSLRTQISRGKVTENLGFVGNGESLKYFKKM